MSNGPTAGVQPLALAVLACLWEKPMYPYEITTTLRQRGKDDSIRLNFGSLYSVIKSLEKHGLITEQRAEREGNRPERTVYEITDDGRTEAHDWLREILAVPEREYPTLEAGLSLVGLLEPPEAADLLRARVATLDTTIASRRTVLEQTRHAGLPEVFAIEADYHLALLQAERDWVERLVERLDAGTVGGQEMWTRMHELLAAGRPAEDVQDEMLRAIGPEHLAELDEIATTERAARAAPPPNPRRRPDPQDPAAGDKRWPGCANTRTTIARVVHEGPSDHHVKTFELSAMLSAQALPPSSTTPHRRSHDVTHHLAGRVARQHGRRRSERRTAPQDLCRAPRRPAVTALDGLSFDVPEGSVFGLLGPNGAGKSTTVKILTTLSRADSGTATVAGLDVARDADAVRRAVGYVAQKPVTDPMDTGRENLVLAGRLQGLARRDARTRADELLERFGLAGAANRLVKTYSGGMARKLDVALGIVHRPQVLFLDEPTTGLDPEARAEMWAEIERMTGDERMTVLLTTHYLEEADRLAARVAIVDRGSVVVEGTPTGLKDGLHGDTVVVELGSLSVSPPDDGPTGARERLTRVVGGAGLVDVVVDGAQVRGRAESGSAALPGVLAALDGAGIEVASATVARPSLDDVYLRYTGRTYGSADRSQTTAATAQEEVAA
ncbi:ATP-binding cassette domain-containing protein [Luteimicrobium album]|uniref:ATP-binding cassette domain-containing protein n=1 Tax=Luteimicrobium album TaxID=1054550 RepID=UPI0032AEB0AD